MFVFVVTWILLGQNSEETVDESAQKQFTVSSRRSVILVISFLFSRVYLFPLSKYSGVSRGEIGPLPYIFQKKKKIVTKAQRTKTFKYSQCFHPVPFVPGPTP